MKTMNTVTEARNDHTLACLILGDDTRSECDRLWDVEGFQDHGVQDHLLVDERADLTQISRDPHHEPYGKGSWEAPAFDESLKKIHAGSYYPRVRRRLPSALPCIALATQLWN